MKIRTERKLRNFLTHFLLVPQKIIATICPHSFNKYTLQQSHDCWGDRIRYCVLCGHYDIESRGSIYSRANPLTSQAFDEALTARSMIERAVYQEWQAASWRGAWKQIREDLEKGIMKDMHISKPDPVPRYRFILSKGQEIVIY